MLGTIHTGKNTAPSFGQFVEVPLLKTLGRMGMRDKRFTRLIRVFTRRANVRLGRQRRYLTLRAKTDWILTDANVRRRRLGIDFHDRGRFYLHSVKNRTHFPTQKAVTTDSRQQFLIFH